MITARYIILSDISALLRITSVAILTFAPSLHLHSTFTGSSLLNVRTHVGHKMRSPSLWVHRYKPGAARRLLATIATNQHPRISQTVIEKVVQKYAVGLPEGKVVKAGDYVMIRPEHVMTHDNTGPVVSKCVF